MSRFPEQKLWTRLTKIMGTRWLPDRVENKAKVGMPDVHFVARGLSGWIELKVLFSWPKKAKTPVRIEHFTTDQKRWLSSRARAGVPTWLLLHIELQNEYLLIPGTKAPAVGALNREELIANAVLYSRGLPGPETLLDILTEVR